MAASASTLARCRGVAIARPCSSQRQHLGASTTRPTLRSLSHCTVTAEVPRGARVITRFTGGSGVVDIVVSDHNEVKELFRDFQLPTTSNERKQQIAYDVIQRLSVHSEKEEMVLYPAVKKHCGQEVADRLLHDQHTLKKILSELDSKKASHADFEATFMRAMQATLQHMADEETNCLPQMSRDLPQDELQSLARSWEKTTATTRPHPAAPNKPPLNAAANAASKPLDAARDAVRDALHPRKDD